jgi:choline monooxygenase
MTGEMRMTPEREIDRFDPTLPLDRAWTPPASWYLEESFFERELRTVFSRNWLFAGREDPVHSPREYFTGQVGRTPFIVARDREARLRAFHNVCRHHAAAVATGEGSAERFVCPYHGWTYDLDGTLLRAPELGGVKDFERSASGLLPIEVEAWGPFVFVALEGGRPSPGKAWVELERRLDATAYRKLVFVRRVSYVLDCNWKVFVDNFLDGGYHVSCLHRGLAAQLDLTSYLTETFDTYSIQTTSGAAARSGESEGVDFRDRVGDEALYAWVYPNFMINRYGEIMDTNWVLPLGPRRTEVIFDYFFSSAVLERAGDFVERSLAASDAVQKEDVEICESVQRGLESGSFDRGRYSVRREKAALHFHRLLHRDLKGE